jgi:hypothetical protein
MKYLAACLLTALSIMGLSSVVFAAGKSGATGGGREAFFRCRDAKGQTFFGDSMPPECQDLDTEVLSDRGTVLRVIDGAATRVQKAAQKTADDAAKKAHDDALMRDRMLVEAYLSVPEIERLRDQRLALVDSQVRIDQQNLTALQDRQQRLLTQVQRFKPYSDKAGAAPIPDHVAEEMVNVVKSSAVTQERIASKQSEQKELQTKFASDIKRFKELKGIK